MASKELLAFTESLTKWMERTPGKDYVLCEAVGEQFSRAGRNTDYKDKQLASLLKDSTGYETTSKLSNVIRAGKSSGGGRIDTHIALYYLAKIDETYRHFVPHIELALFGKNKVFFDIFEWCPTRDLILRAEPPAEPEAHVLPLGPEIRLREPGVHSHPSHFSNRAVEKIIGRDEEEKALRRFATPDPGFRWLQLAGAGGQGKSRMAYDLMEEVKREGWEAGFLSKADLDEFQGKAGDYRPDSWRSWNPSKPHLIIIDYVIGREADIGFAMDQMADQSGEFNVAVRVLLIERQRWDQGPKLSQVEGAKPVYRCEGRADWFTKLNGYDQVSGRWRNDLSANNFVALPSIIELFGLSQEYLIMIVRESSNIDLNHPEKYISRWLANIDGSGSPLYAHFLSQVPWGNEFIISWNKSSIIEYVFNQHCAKVWNRTWGDCPKLDSQHPSFELMALAVLMGSIDCHDLVYQAGWNPIDKISKLQALAISDNHITGSMEGIGHIIFGLKPTSLGIWAALSVVNNKFSTENLINTSLKINPKSLGEFVIRANQEFMGHEAIVKILEYIPADTSYLLSYADFLSTIEWEFRYTTRMDYIDKGYDWIRKTQTQMTIMRCL